MGGARSGVKSGLSGPGMVGAETGEQNKRGAYKRHEGGRGERKGELKAISGG